MIKNILAITLLSVSATSMATEARKLTVDSSWDEILNSPNAEVVGGAVKLDKGFSNVFSVVHKDGVFYTKQPTQNGYYNLTTATSEQGAKYIETDKTVKTGLVTIQEPVYEYDYSYQGTNQGITGELVGYEEYQQPLTRTLKVYQARGLGQTSSKGNPDRRFLFEKEYTIQEKM